MPWSMRSRVRGFDHGRRQNSGTFRLRALRSGTPGTRTEPNPWNRRNPGNVWNPWRGPPTAPNGPSGSVKSRGVPQERWLRGPRHSDRDGTDSRHRGGDRVEIDGPRWRGLSNRTQVGCGRSRITDPSLRRLQRGRVRTGDIQGSRVDGVRPVRTDRSDDDL